MQKSVFAARSGFSPLCTGNTALQYSVQRCYFGHTALELSAMLLWAYRFGIVCCVTLGIPLWNCLLCYCGHTALEVSVMLLWVYRIGIFYVTVGIPLWNRLLCCCGHTALELSVMLRHWNCLMLLWAYRFEIVCYVTALELSVTVGVPLWNCLLCYCGHTALK